MIKLALLQCLMQRPLHSEISKSLAGAAAGVGSGRSGQDAGVILAAGQGGVGECRRNNAAAASLSV